MEAQTQPPPTANWAELDSDEIASIASEDLHDNRPNRWHGPKSSWRSLTEEERTLWQSMKRLGDQDLAVHLYDTFALKKRARDPATAQDLTVHTVGLLTSRPYGVEFSLTHIFSGLDRTPPGHPPSCGRRGRWQRVDCPHKTWWRDGRMRTSHSRSVGRSPSCPAPISRMSSARRYCAWPPRDSARGRGHGMLLVPRSRMPKAVDHPRFPA